MKLAEPGGSSPQRRQEINGFLVVPEQRIAGRATFRRSVTKPPHIRVPALSLALNLVRRQFGSDLLAGISIVAAVLLEEYLAGAFVVLMLSTGTLVPVVAVVSLLCLIALGSIAARVGEAPVFVVAARVTIWGMLAMIATAAVGRLFGTAVG
jgi:VIT1/CCC1 family predicted Fe2+/Mn2+ transporter